jgi:Carboxypeptidase regulatory-like domain
VKVNRARLAAIAAFVAITTGFIPSAQHPGLFGTPAAVAQNLGQRNVTGSVVDDTSTPVAGATVFLRNLKTKSIRSYTSSANGRFRFAQVNMAEDFDIWAEKEGKKTATKTVSSWDARKDFETELKMK